MARAGYQLRGRGRPSYTHTNPPPFHERVKRDGAVFLIAPTRSRKSVRVEAIPTILNRAHFGIARLGLSETIEELPSGCRFSRRA